MIIEKKRLMKMFYYLIAADDVVRAIDIAHYADVSERTVKSDLEELKNFAQASGCVLHSRKGHGYWLEVLDEKIFNPVKDQLYYQFSELNYTKEYETRANEIARRLLVQTDFIKLDDLADQMFLSRSSIKNSLREVRKLLESFKLELESKPGYGVKVKGLEINIRFCMLELFINHHATSVSFLEDSEYLSFFDTDIERVGAMRHIFLKTLRESTNRICDHYTHRVVRYISMMHLRHSRGFHLHFTETTKEVLRTMSEYNTASQVLKDIRVTFTELVDDENEIFGIELLLLMWNDLTDTDSLQERYSLFYEDVGNLADKIIHEIDFKWNVNFNLIPETRQALIAGLIPSFTVVYFHAIGYRMIGRHVENNALSSSPICVSFARTAAKVLLNEYNTKLKAHEILNLAGRFYYCLNKIHYDYKPRRVLLSAQSGNQSCSIIRDKMLNKFGKDAFDCIETVGFYEVRRLNQADYDFMILNFGPFYYRYDLPMIYVDAIPNERQMNQIYAQVVLGGYQIEPLLRKLDLNHDFVFNDINYESKEGMIELISFKAAKDSNCVNALKNELLEIGDTCVWNEIAFLMSNTSCTEGNRFEIYQLSKAAVWQKKTIKTVIYLAVDFKEDLQLMRFVEQFTHEIMDSQMNLDRLLQTKALHQILEIVKCGLRSG